MIKVFVSVWLLMSMTLSVRVNALTLEIITDQPNSLHHVAQLRQRGIHIIVHDLMAGKRMEATLGQGLTGSEQHAHQQLQQRIASIGRKQFEAQLKHAFQAMIQSVAYELDRHPAIVFNQGEAVVYGVTDLQAAVGYYQHWKARQ